MAATKPTEAVAVNEKWAAITARNLHPEKLQHIVNFVNWIDENMVLPDEPATPKGEKDANPH